MQDAHEGLAAPLQHGDNLAAPALGLPGLLLGHRHPDGVPVQGTPRLGGLHIHIFLLPLNPHKHKSFPGHQDFPFVFRHNPGLFFLSAGGRPPVTASLSS